VKLAESFDNPDEALLNDSNGAWNQQEDDARENDGDDGDHGVPLIGLADSAS
jgi:hypothetical protein